MAVCGQINFLGIFCGASWFLDYFKAGKLSLSGNADDNQQINCMGLEKKQDKQEKSTKFIIILDFFMVADFFSLFDLLKNIYIVREIKSGHKESI